MRIAVRLGAVLVLGAYGSVRWMHMLDPRPVGRAWAGVALALAVGFGAVALGRIAGRRRAVALVALGVVAVIAVLLLAGVPLRMFAPKRLDSLTNGLLGGIGNLPEVEVPFRGATVGWTARVILASGILLTVLAALAAGRPGVRDRPCWLAAVLIGVLIGLPAVVLPDAGVGPGILLFVGLVALLTLDRVRRPNVAAAGVALAMALVLGIALFPSLDGPRPWFDYEAAAEKLVPRPVTFDWSHSYGTLRWARDGRELLRIDSDRSYYWKAEDLDEFDGLRWRAPEPTSTQGGVTESDLLDRAAARPQDVHTIDVTVRSLRSPFVVAAGDALAVTKAPREILPAPSTGTFAASPSLRQGDTYRARIYAPTPAPAELRDAAADYPDYLTRDRNVPTPPAAAAEAGPAGEAARAETVAHNVPVVVPPLWPGTGPSQLYAPADGRTVEQVEADSAYARVWRLAARLRAKADTPYAYAETIEAYLSRGFTYTESPPPAHVPLAAFLLRDRRGYCQHFSGAMALLLRMGGVPARVASGFSPGSRDPDTGEWVIRDFDAHSWVEAFFPGYGWVTFDPTPAASPARGQVTKNRVPEFGSLSSGRRGVVKKLTDPLAGTGGGTTTFRPGAGRDRGGFPVWLAVVGILLLAALAAAVVIWHRRRSGPPAEVALAELERALRRSGRDLSAETTLRQLEERFRDSTEAAGYVRAVRDLRYGAGGPGPSPSERRALRRELVRGLGASGAVRGFWVVPPEPPRRRPRVRV